MVKKDERTRKIFEYLCDYEERYGYPPSLREIADKMGFISNSGVIRHLDRLEGWGWIARAEGVARGIQILEPCTAPKNEIVPQAPPHARRQ